MSPRLLVPGISTLVMLAVLLFLGSWQVQRMVWKQDVLAAIATAERAPPMPLGLAPAPFTRVRVEGVFAPGKAVAYGSETRNIRGATVGGARVVAVLLPDDGPPVLVDQGWIPDTLANPLPVSAAGHIVVEGYVRPAETGGWFTPAPDLQRKRFYALDPVAIGRALGVTNLAPFIVVAMVPTGIGEPARAMPRPANNHLTYALTWYGLAVVLLVIFAIYVRKVRRP